MTTKLRSMTPKLLAATVVTAAVLTAGATTTLTGPGPLATRQAHAMIIGGDGSTSTGVPGSTYSPVYCRTGSISVAPEASVQYGFTGGQYISYRYYLSNNRGYQGYSGWSGAQYVGFNNYLRSRLPPSTFSAAINTVWSVQVQYAHWRFQNGQWVASYQWQPATYVIHTDLLPGSFSGSSYTTNACYT
jgi:hypothetical protein